MPNQNLLNRAKSIIANQIYLMGQGLKGKDFLEIDECIKRFHHNPEILRADQELTKRINKLREEDIDMKTALKMMQTISQGAIWMRRAVLGEVRVKKGEEGKEK